MLFTVAETDACKTHVAHSTLEAQASQHYNLRSQKAFVEFQHCNVEAKQSDTYVADKQPLQPANTGPFNLMTNPGGAGA